MRVDLRDPDRKPEDRKYRVLLDGLEVTSACFMFDDQDGIVGLYLRDETGHFYKNPDTDTAALEFRKGVVTVLQLIVPALALR